MSRKLLFSYIISSIAVAFTLVIIGVTAKVFLGGLNVNFIEQRLSSYLKTEHEINLKSDDYILFQRQICCSIMRYLSDPIKLQLILT